MGRSLPICPCGITVVVRVPSTSTPSISCFPSASLFSGSDFDMTPPAIAPLLNQIGPAAAASAFNFPVCVPAGILCLPTTPSLRAAGQGCVRNRQHHPDHHAHLHRIGIIERNEIVQCGLRRLPVHWKPLPDGVPSGPGSVYH